MSEHVRPASGAARTESSTGSSSTTATKDVPHPDSSAKPDSPADISKPSWRFVARKTFREFLKDECTDIAAALTYYGVLALFPAIIALLSLVGLFGQGPQTVDAFLQILRDLGAGSVAGTLEPVLTSLSTASGAGLALIGGLLASLWSASGYVNSFSRAMNRIYEIDEGRPIWKLRPAMLVVTLVMLLLTAVVGIALVLTGPAAEAVGRALGLGSTVVTVWSIAKWPVLLGMVVVIVAVLYWATPNIEQPKFRWVSLGALLAIVVWIVASAAFGLYVANFSSYNETYGSLAGVIVFLLWLWITNLALLFGAELDAELERSRELQAGIAAEEQVQLPLRDTTKIEKAEEKRREDIERGRRLRLTQGESQEPRGDQEIEQSIEQEDEMEDDKATREGRRSMRNEKNTNTSAKILYRPVGLVTSVLAGIVAGQVFKQAWKHGTAGSDADAPKALESEYGLRQILVAAAVQGAIFATVKALADRGGARLFQRWTGEWPGD